MATILKVPSVGESITEVTIAQWLKNDGDHVEMDEVICELESEKATFELNAEAAGILKIQVKAGETIEIGTTIGAIETDSQSAPEASPDEPQKDKKQTEGSTTKVETTSGKTGEVIEMRVPAVGESITEVTISTWIKGDGDHVVLDDVIAEIESDKATFELTAEASGILHHVADEGETLDIDALICTIEETEGAGTREKDSGEPATEMAGERPPATGDTYAKGHPSPAAAKLMAEKGIEADKLIGSGPGGRITKEDVEGYKPQDVSVKDEKEKASDTPEEKKEISYGETRSQERRKLSQLRKTVSRRLVAVKNETAMLTTFNEVNMKPVMDLRKKYKDKFKERYEVNLGFMSFFAKACCVALREWPSVNAYIDGDEMVYNHFVDISIAVSAPKGLVVPVIRNAESLSFAEIEKEVLNLATKARDNKLSIEEMTGGTFTITNGGVFGSMLSTPIINAPQSAILGMHNIVERPVVENGDIVVRPVMYVALSYDHRIIDGRESVSFLVRIKELLEDPARLMLEI